jgi:hypothetical protein
MAERRLREPIADAESAHLQALRPQHPDHGGVGNFTDRSDAWYATRRRDLQEIWQSLTGHEFGPDEEREWRGGSVYVRRLCIAPQGAVEKAAALAYAEDSALKVWTWAGHLFPNSTPATRNALEPDARELALEQAIWPAEHERRHFCGSCGQRIRDGALCGCS